MVITDLPLEAADGARAWGGYLSVLVASSDKKTFYTVVRSAGHWTCTCPDFTYRADSALYACKHIISVRDAGLRSDWL